MSREFKEFPKIHQLAKAQMQVTQKIHGTNAQVVVIPVGEINHSTDVEVDDKWYRVYVGSRTRWIYPGDDNYGFAQFVHTHREAFVRCLGEGVHFGEWAGPGINSGEGLTEKTFVLFDFWRYPPERPLPPQTRVVPVLYEGTMDLTKVTEVMLDLKENGSKLAPGFMRPEGVVVSVLGTRYKKVFDVEETQWTKAPKHPSGPKVERPDYGHLLQPIRLEKLLSRDERYVREFPASLVSVVTAYLDDLIAEGQIQGDDGMINAVRKGASSQVFNFVRKTMEGST